MSMTGDERIFTNNALETGAKLDRYFIPTRYPNGLPELTPDEAYFEEDAQGALLLAQNLIDCVEKIIGAV
jgi:HEPN domain-containing protein